MTRDDLIVLHRGYAKGLALQLARKYGIASEETRDEMIQAAEVGLVEAAGSFDPDRGAQFTTFAYYRIRGAALDFLRELKDLPARQAESVRDAAAFNDVAESMAARDEGGDGLPERQRRTYAATAFSDAVGRLGAAFSLTRLQSAAHLPDSDRASPGQRAESEESRMALARALSALTEDQKAIIELKYRQGLSMSQIGARLQCDKATVSRRHEAALDAMAKSMGVQRGPRPGE